MPEGRERSLSASDQNLNQKLLITQQYTLDIVRLLTNDMQLHELGESARSDSTDYELVGEIEEARKKIRVTMAVISASFFGWAQRIRTAMAVQAAGLPPVDPAKVRLTREGDDHTRPVNHADLLTPEVMLGMHDHDGAIASKELRQIIKAGGKGARAQVNVSSRGPRRWRSEAKPKLQLTVL